MNSSGEYLFEGKEYDSLSELPPDAKLLYENNNTDNLLDVYRISHNEESIDPSFEINGKKYSNINVLPLELKEKLLDKLALLEKQGLKLLVNDKRIKEFDDNLPGANNNFSKEASAEITSAFKYKLLIGIILFLAALFFIFNLITSYLKTK